MANIKPVFHQKRKKSRKKPRFLGFLKLSLLMLLILMLMPDWQVNLPRYIFREIPQERMTTAHCDGFIHPGNEIHKVNYVY